MNYVLVFIGGGLGSMARHFVNVTATRLAGTGFPYGTLSINILGSFLMGAVVEYAALKSSMSPATRLFLTTGILGGYTTFSTFSLESITLYQRGETAAAIAYIVLSIALGLGGLVAGMAVVRHFA